MSFGWHAGEEQAGWKDEEEERMTMRSVLVIESMGRGVMMRTKR